MKVANNWKKRLKSYSSLSMMANIFTALSVTGLSVVGVLSSEIAFATILVAVVILGIFGLIGRVLDQGIDDGIIEDRGLFEENKEDV